MDVIYCSSCQTEWWSS